MCFLTDSSRIYLLKQNSWVTEYTHLQIYNRWPNHSPKWFFHSTFWSAVFKFQCMCCHIESHFCISSTLGVIKLLKIYASLMVDIVSHNFSWISLNTIKLNIVIDHSGFSFFVVCELHVNIISPELTCRSSLYLQDFNPFPCLYTADIVSICGFFWTLWFFWHTHIFNFQLVRFINFFLPGLCFSHLV